MSNNQEAQELIRKITFVSNHIVVPVLDKHKFHVQDLFEDVVDHFVGTMTLMTARRGSVVWPEDQDETGFKYNYDHPPAFIADQWRRYCLNKGIDVRELVMALSVDLKDPIWKESKDFIDKAKKVL